MVAHAGGVGIFSQQVIRTPVASTVFKKSFANFFLSITILPCPLTIPTPRLLALFFTTSIFAHQTGKLICPNSSTESETQEKNMQHVKHIAVYSVNKYPPNTLFIQFLLKSAAGGPESTYPPNIMHRTLELPLSRVQKLMWIFFNFLVRLLFVCGFYSRAAYMAMFWICKTGKSGPEHVKWQCNLTLRVLQNCFKCKQTFWQAKKGRIVLHRPIWAAFYELWLSLECGLLSCNLSPEKVQL